MYRIYGLRYASCQVLLHIIHAPALHKKKYKNEWMKSSQAADAARAGVCEIDSLMVFCANPEQYNYFMELPISTCTFDMCLKNEEI